MAQEGVADTHWTIFQILPEDGLQSFESGIFDHETLHLYTPFKQHAANHLQEKFYWLPMGDVKIFDCPYLGWSPGGIYIRHVLLRCLFTFGRGRYVTTTRGKGGDVIKIYTPLRH